MRIEDLIACAKRELAMRESVYPKRVSTGKMRASQAASEIDMMAEIVNILEKIGQDDDWTYCVAAYYPEGYGGTHNFISLQEALKYREYLMNPNMGFKEVHVWREKQMIEIVERKRDE